MKKLDKITDTQWAEVNEFNRFIVEDFILNSTEKSKQTLKAYESNLKIWFIWVKDNLNNKSQIDIKPLEFKRFINWMINRGCSSADCNNKRAAISSLNNYIEVYYGDEYKTFRNFINKSIQRPPKSFVHEKQPLTIEEFNHLIAVLTEKQEWQKIAYLKFTLETGCRRAESAQLLKDIVNAEPVIKTREIKHEDGTVEQQEIKFYTTHTIRCKGRGTVGKVRKFRFGQDTMDAIVKWLEVRGEDDCPYMFITKYKGEIKQVGENTFNSWSNSVFEPIIGRRFHPHLLRESRATQMVVEEGMDIKLAQKLLGHESSETTEIYVIRDDTDELDDLYTV